MDALTAIETARQKLEAVTPLKGDCGLKCGRICCRPDETGKGGMLLFPGEETYYENDPDFILSSDETLVRNGILAVCSGVCDRTKRPLSCRFFPLRPSIKHTICIDRRSLMLCPIAEYGMHAFSPSFIRNAAEAAEVLLSVPELNSFIAELGIAIRRIARESRL